MKLLLVLLVAACDAPALPSDQYDAIAVELTAGLGVDQQAIEIATEVVYDEFPAGFYADGSAVSGSENGIDISYLVSCGMACDAQTASATVAYVSAGATYLFESLVEGASSTTITHDGVWTIDAALDGTIMVTGSTTFDDDATIADVSYQFTITASYALAIDELGASGTGTAALDIGASEAGGSGATTFSAKGAVTFFADDTAALLLDNSRAYTINFENATVGSGSD